MGFPPQGSGISNALQLVQTVTVGIASTSITFNNLDINTDKRYFLETFVNNQQANTNYYIFVNNDTTLGNYFKTSLSADFGVSAVSSTNTPEFIFGSQIDDRFYGELRIVLGDDGKMRCYNQLYRDVFIPNPGIWVSSIICTDVLANITRLDITGSNANAIGIGSFFRLYRVKP